MTVNGLTVLIAAAVVIAWFLGARAALRRWDGSHDPQTPRRFPSLGAWGTRAGRRMLGCVRRRAGTTFRHARDWARGEWAGLGDTGPTVWADRNAGRFDSALGSPATGHASADAAGLPTLAGPSDLPDGGGPQSPAPVRQPTRKATGAERDAAGIPWYTPELAPEPDPGAWAHETVWFSLAAIDADIADGAS